MATVKMPAMIPRIRTKFGCFLLFESTCEVEAEYWLAGASMGEVATRGAVYQTQSYVNIHSTELTSIKQSLTLGMQIYSNAEKSSFHQS